MIGANLYVTVKDADMNQLIDRAEPCQITFSVNGGDENSLTLQENNVNTGIFTGLIESASNLQMGANVTNPIRLGMLESDPPSVSMTLSPGDILNLAYVDQAPVQIFTRSVTVFDSNVGGADIGLSSGQLQYSQNILLRSASLGDSIPINIIDADLNKDANTIEVAMAYVASSLGDILPVYLTETDMNSSVFSGIFETSDKLQPEPRRYLAASEGSTITCIYEDQAPRLQIRSRSVVRLNMFSKLSVASPYIRGGESLTLTVVDTDLDSSDSVQTSQVSVNSFSDSESLQVTETSGTSGMFTGVLPTTLLYSDAVPNSGLLNVIPNTTITASCVDLNSSVAISLVVNVVLSQIGELFTAPAHVTLNAGSVYGSISISVSDPDWNFGPYGPKECSVWLAPVNATMSLNGLFQEAVIGLTLVEKASDSGVFATNMTVTSDSSVKASQIREQFCLKGPRDWGACKADSDCGGSGLCQRVLYAPYSNVALLADMSYHVLYKDLRPTGTTILSSLVTVHSPGVIEVAPIPLVLGESLPITVRDLGYSGSREPLSVMAFSSAVPDQYVAVSMAETGSSTGVFTGTLQTVSGQGPNMISLGVAEGDTVTLISRKSKSDQSNLSTTVLVATTARLFVSPSTVRLNGRWSITVVDKDQRVNSSCVVSLNSFDELTSTYSQAVELTLKETSPASGVFTADLLNSDSGIFRVQSNFSETFTVIHGVHVFDIINITLSDFFPKVLVRTSFKVLNSAAGVIVLDPLSFSGQNLYLNITDKDQDYNYTRVDYISATFRSMSTGDNETLILAETGHHSGIFTGQILSKSNLSSQSVDDGVLGTGASDNVLCEYFDVAPAATVTAATRFAPSHLGSLSIIPPHFAVGDMVTISVVDHDIPRLVQVTISSIEAPFLPVVVTLNSTGMNAGSFTGVLNSSFGVSGGTDFIFSYQDSAPDRKSVV